MAGSERIRSFLDVKYHSEVLAIVLSFFIVSQCLALCTFTADMPGSNILGLYGHATAAMWYIFLGPVSFIGILALGYLQRTDEIRGEAFAAPQISRQLCHIHGCRIGDPLKLLLVDDTQHQGRQNERQDDGDGDALRSHIEIVVAVYINTGVNIQDKPP